MKKLISFLMASCICFSFLTAVSFASSSKAGDLNKDGKADIADVVSAFKFVAGKNELSADEKDAADINRDGKLTLSDVQRILLYVANKITNLGTYNYTTTNKKTQIFFSEVCNKTELNEKITDTENGSFEFSMVKNEKEGYQFIIRNDDEDINNLSVTVSSLANENGKTIDQNRIMIYRAMYMYLFAKKDPITMPDALVPLYEDNNSYTVAAGENQAYYLQVETTEEDEAGTYIGEITALYDGGEVKIPVTVNVENVTLPQTPSSQTAFGIWHYPAMYTNSDEARIRLYEYMLENRMSGYTIPGADGSSPEAFVASVLKYATDERVTSFIAPVYATTDANGYYVFDVEKQTKLFTLLKENGIFEKAYFYQFDEPHGQATLDIIRKFSDDLYAIEPEMVNMIPFTMFPSGLTNTVTRFCMVRRESSQSTISYLRSQPRAQGIWWYGTEELRIGFNDNIDAKTLFWNQFELGITGYLEWAIDGYKLYNSHTNEYLDGFRDVFSNPYFFYPEADSPDADGDSYLVYPGKVGDGIVNRDIVIPSVRFETVRDGIEDYDLLALRKAQIEEKIKENNITNYTADDAMNLYYLSVNNLNYDTMGKSISAFDRYTMARKELINDIEKNPDIILFINSTEKETGLFEERQITVYVPSGKTLKINGAQAETENNFYKATALLSQPATNMLLQTEEDELDYVLYSKIITKSFTLTSFDEDTFEKLKAANKSTADGLLLTADGLQITLDAKKRVSIPYTALIDETQDFSSYDMVMIKVKNNNTEPLKDFEYSIFAGPQSASYTSQTPIEPEKTQTVYIPVSIITEQNRDRVSKILFAAPVGENNKASYTIESISLINTK